MLEANPRMSQRELAQALGISLGKTNYCLRALMDRGLVKAGNFRRSDRKLGSMYQLTPAGLDHRARLTLDFLRRKSAEFEALKRELAALEAEARALVRERR